MTTPDPAVRALIEDLWREQSLWSRTANRMKKGIERARRGALVLVVLVAVVGALAGALADAAPVPARVLAGIAAAGALVLPMLRPAWSGTRLRDWTRVRAVSEALKSAVYLSLAGAGPYAGDVSGAELRKRTDQLSADADDLVHHRLGVEPAERRIPKVTDARSYFVLRVRDQIDDYYEVRARDRRTALRRFRIAEMAVGGGGAVLGAVAAAVGATFAAWIAVLATVGSALATHVAAARYEYELIEFTRTAQRLRRLDRDAGRTTDPAQLRVLVEAAEDAISAENKGWMAKAGEDPPDHSAGAENPA